MTDVRLSGVERRFDQRVVLDGVDAEIAAGEFAALLGRSGSGKSTLLNIIAGIESLDAGEVWVGNQRIDVLAEPERTLLRRRCMGFVFQSFNLIATLSVMENVVLPLTLVGCDDPDRQASDLLGRLGLGDTAHRYPESLSGGEQQRVAVARALIHQPSLVLADEPTGNLDTDTGEAVIHLMSELCREFGATFIVATHDLDLAARADRRLVLSDGRLVNER